MNADRLAILHSLGENPTLGKLISCASKLDRLDAVNETVAYAIVRNITLEPALPAALKVRSAQRGFKATVTLGEFGAAQQAAFDSTSFLYTQPADVVVVALHLQTLAPSLVVDFAHLSTARVEELVASALDAVLMTAAAVRERSAALILVHNFELPRSAAFGVLDAVMQQGQLNVLRAMNLELARRVASINACYIVDVDHLLANAGYEAALDDRYWHIGRAPYAFSFVGRLADEYAKFGAALRGKTKKCLVLDCDNTLWGGVIGEDGMHGIALGETHPGSAFVQFQAAILNLYHRGVLLALNSKNNHADAMQVFESHPKSLLRPDHFVSVKINWADKVTNLREIAVDLNIGLDSLVFVDDNPFECQYVRENLPDVTVVQLPADPTRYAQLLSGAGYFDTLVLSAEDRRRSEMYRSQAQREVLKASAGSMSEYLASLDMRLTISDATPFSIPRIAQLTQKTNQFNLTTRRYSEGDVMRMAADPNWHVYCAELVDKFDTAGIIAVAIVRDIAGVAQIDTFLMSCRVIGRGVEQACIAHLAQAAAQRGLTRLAGEYLPTAKNGLVTDFYRSAGFGELAGSAGTKWELDLREALPAAPAWFAEIVTDAPVAV